jgi:hypothetical protein
MTNARYYGMPGAPSRPSQRRAKPRVLSAPTFRIGDKVRWNGRYSGTIIDVLGDEVIIDEQNSLLGGNRQWRLALAALTR